MASPDDRLPSVVPMATMEVEMETMMEEARLNVSGMTCGSCKRRVASALRAVPGVSDVEVDRAAGSARVAHDGSVDMARLVAAVQAAGYHAAPASAALEVCHA